MSLITRYYSTFQTFEEILKYLNRRDLALFAATYSLARREVRQYLEHATLERFCGTIGIADYNEINGFLYGDLVNEFIVSAKLPKYGMVRLGYDCNRDEKEIMINRAAELLNLRYSEREELEHSVECVFRKGSIEIILEINFGFESFELAHGFNTILNGTLACFFPKTQMRFSRMDYLNADVIASMIVECRDYRVGHMDSLTIAYINVYDGFGADEFDLSYFGHKNLENSFGGIVKHFLVQAKIDMQDELYDMRGADYIMIFLREVKKENVTLENKKIKCDLINLRSQIWNEFSSKRKVDYDVGLEDGSAITNRKSEAHQVDLGPGGKIETLLGIPLV